VRSLHERGYERQDILELFRFIDWVLRLPETLEDPFWVELSAYEEAHHMPYITSVERIGFKKGMKQGLQEGLQEGFQQGISQGEALVLKRLLMRRFGPLPEEVEDKLAQADRSQLESWADRVLDAETLEEVFEQRL
jgi:flagellar biosynthesis/type III secretory pathway protein FliH